MLGAQCARLNRHRCSESSIYLDPVLPQVQNPVDPLLRVICRTGLARACCRVFGVLFLLSGFAAMGSAAEDAAWPDPERYRDVMEAWALVTVPKRALVAVGSSSMRFWSLGDRFAKDFAPITTVNRGFGGSVMNDVAYFLDEAVLALEPRAVMIYEGDNDLSRGISPDAIISSLRGIIARLHAHNPEIRVYVFSVKPSLARASLWPLMQVLNQSYESLAQSDERITYVNVAVAMLKDSDWLNPDLFIADGLHLSAAGYDVWRQVVRQTIVPIERPFERAYLEASK